MPLSGVAEMSELTSVVVMHAPLWENMVLSLVAGPCG